MVDSLYLDWAASAPLRPAARAAMQVALEQAQANPSSIHRAGQAARAVLDDARHTLASVLDVHPSWVILTSGGTEANNLALRGMAQAEQGPQKGTILCSAAEHDCIRKTTLAVGGEWLPVDAKGVISLPALEERLKQGGVALVSVMLANNETGVLSPLADVVALCRAHGVPTHTDAVQALGHLPFTFEDFGVDMLTVSSHKIGGPQGMGALIVRPELALDAQLTGGAQERNRRAGTENVLAAAGFAAALKDMAAHQTEEIRHMQTLADWLDANVPAPLAMVAPYAPKVPHIRQLITPMAGGDAVIRLDLAGIAASQGSACSSGKVTESPVLHAMGLAAEAGRAVRLSWGPTTPLEHLQRAVALLAQG